MTKFKKAHFSWVELGSAYAAISTLCNPNDWFAMLSELATHVAGSNARHVKVLDIGAGIGLTSSFIRREMYNKHGLTSDWILVDPDETAQLVQPHNFPEIGTNFKVEYCGELPRNAQLDAVLIIHSSYYMGDLDETLRICWDRFLAPGGVIAVAAMPKSSQFFSPEFRNICSGTSEEVRSFFSQRGLVVETHQLESRLQWLGGAVNDPLLEEKIAQFVLSRIDVSREEIEMIRKRFSGQSIDFQDEIIVARKI